MYIYREREKERYTYTTRKLANYSGVCCQRRHTNDKILRGSKLSNITRLTRVLFKGGESCSNS